jgi:hypothetical protein
MPRNRDQEIWWIEVDPSYGAIRQRSPHGRRQRATATTWVALVIGRPPTEDLPSASTMMGPQITCPLSMITTELGLDGVKTAFARTTIARIPANSAAAIPSIRD